MYVCGWLHKGINLRENIIYEKQINLLVLSPSMQP